MHSVRFRGWFLGAGLGMIIFAAGAMRVSAAELLLFHTPGCVWCAQWDREVGPGYPKSTEGQRAPLRRLDVADAGHAGVALTSPVTVSPTFVLVDNGREVARITGYPGADFFWGLLAQAMAKLKPAANATTPPKTSRQTVLQRPLFSRQVRFS